MKFRWGFTLLFLTRCFTWGPDLCESLAETRFWIYLWVFFPFDWCLDFLPFFAWFSFKTSHPLSTITRRQSILWLPPQYPQVSRTSHGCQLYLAPSPTSQSIICTLSPFVEAIIMMKMSKNNLCSKFTEY